MLRRWDHPRWGWRWNAAPGLATRGGAGDKTLRIFAPRAGNAEGGLFGFVAVCSEMTGRARGEAICPSPYNKIERSISVKRNSVVVVGVLFILALFFWEGWASFQARKLAAGRERAAAAVGQPASGSAGSASQPASSLQGKPAPAFTLEDLEGKKVSLAGYKGKALMLNFWATWCGPCKIETPWLIDLRDKYEPQGFEVLGISVDDLDHGNAEIFADQKRGIARFAQQMHMPYPVLVDGNSVSEPYGGLDELPTSFFVNRNGTVVAMQVGVTSKDEIEGNIRKALGM
jgi:cytochrome c biogenesis protein CcmG/thiol:disulfide interchange protein DsbE